MAASPPGCSVVAGAPRSPRGARSSRGRSAASATTSRRWTGTSPPTTGGTAREHEAAVRQTRVEGTAVVETRVRIPNGDAVQRVYSVPDARRAHAHRGRERVAAADRRGVHPWRPALRAPADGADRGHRPARRAASRSRSGHHATLTVALAHDGGGAGHAAQRAAAGDRRGARLAGDRRACRPAAAARPGARPSGSSRERCELALAGPAHPDDDPVGVPARRRPAGAHGRAGRPVDARRGARASSSRPSAARRTGRSARRSTPPTVCSPPPATTVARKDLAADARAA